MKVLSGVYPHGTLRGRHPLRGRARRVPGHPRLRAARHRHHPPGARAEPVPVDRGEHLPRQRAGASAGVIDWNKTNARGRQAARPRRASRAPRHQDHRHRRRQAAARRDRQGALQAGQAAHPRRAHRGAERRRQRAPARPDPQPQGAGHHLDHHQPQAQRDRGDRRHHDDHPRRQDHRDPRHARGRAGHRGADHPRDGRALARQPVPGPRPRRSARRCSGSRTGRCTTRSTRRAWSSTTRTSTCAAARSSASPASWVPAAPSSR